MRNCAAAASQNEKERPNLKVFQERSARRVRGCFLITHVGGQICAKVVASFVGLCLGVFCPNGSLVGLDVLC